MMPKHSSRAPWGRRFTAMIAVSLLTLGACSDSDGGAGPSSIETVGIVTLPNNQTLTNLIPGDKRKILGIPTNSKGNFIDKPVTLESSNPAIFTVVGDTIVAQLGGGTAYLRATAGGQTDSVAIGVRFRVAAIALTPAAPTIRREATQQITAVARDANPLVAGGAIVTGRTINWTSSDPSVATVSATGLVSATATAANGSTTTITATAPNTADGGVATVASIVLTVNGDAVVSSVVVTGGSGLRGNLGTVQLAAQPRSGLGNNLVAPITWTTNNAAVATVDASGLVTFAGGVANVTITATAAGAGLAGANVAGTAVFEVLENMASGAVKAVPTLAANANQFYVVNVPANADSVKWVMSGGTGDLDIYLRRPGSTANNFASFNDGNGELILVTPATPNQGGTVTTYAGWWRVQVNAFVASSGANLTATIFTPAP